MAAICRKSKYATKVPSIWALILANFVTAAVVAFVNSFMNKWLNIYVCIFMYVQSNVI